LKCIIIIVIIIIIIIIGALSQMFSAVNVAGIKIAAISAIVNRFLGSMAYVNCVSSRLFFNAT